VFVEEFNSLYLEEQVYAPLPWMLEGAKARDAFVALEFESTQFGLVHLKSGKFFSLGQD
jgi:hypothetical protein